MLFHLTTKDQVFHRKGYANLVLTVMFHTGDVFQGGKDKQVEVDRGEAEGILTASCPWEEQGESTRG